MKKPNVAIVYDRVNTFGGAERVLLALRTVFPDSTLFTSIANEQTAPWSKGWKIQTSFLQRIPFFRTRHRALGLIMPLLFEQFDFSNFDLVISVTSESAKGILTKPGTRHISYLLTPTRYLWHQHDEYRTEFLSGNIRRFLRVLYDWSIRYLRKWDRIAIQRPDLVVPISNVVKKRCEYVYGRNTTKVIYPPVSFTSSTHRTHSTAPLSEPYFLCVSRLVQYKRIDLAINACMRLHKRLVVVGDGPELRSLQAMASGSDMIQFVQHLTDRELVRYYQHCVSVLSPGEEDFGISALEALANGKPAVVFKKSGHAELIEDGRQGVVLQNQSVREMIRAIGVIERSSWDGDELRQTAKKVDIDTFLSHWRSLI